MSVEGKGAAGDANTTITGITGISMITDRRAHTNASPENLDNTDKIYAKQMSINQMKNILKKIKSSNCDPNNLQNVQIKE